jgi:CRP-like cAMP-binding protein
VAEGTAVEKDWNQELAEIAFAPGDFLFHENESTYHFFVIIEGDVEIFKTDADGTVYPLAMVSSGSSVGEFAMIDRQPRSASARAKTSVRATRISEAAYEHLLEELPEWAMSVMRALVERLRMTNEIVRRHKITNPEIVHAVDALEFDSDSTIIDDSPFLSDPSEEED